MNIINVIDILYNENINYITKFNLYKLIKKNTINFSYYKTKKLFNKLVDTQVLISSYKENLYKFNKVHKKQTPIILTFD